MKTSTGASVLVMIGLLVLSACSSSNGPKVTPSPKVKPGEEITSPAEKPDCEEFYRFDFAFKEIKHRLRAMGETYKVEKLSQTERRALNSALLSEVYDVYFTKRTSPLFNEVELQEIIKMYELIFSPQDVLRAEFFHPLKNKCL